MMDFCPPSEMRANDDPIMMTFDACIFKRNYLFFLLVLFEMSVPGMICLPFVQINCWALSSHVGMAAEHSFFFYLRMIEKTLRRNE